jgi:hypothetical protein
MILIHCGKALQGPPESGKFRGYLNPFYVLSSMACLTRKQEMNLDKTARSLQSWVPIYVSMINNISVVGNNYTIASKKLFCTHFICQHYHSLYS